MISHDERYLMAINSAPPTAEDSAYCPEPTLATMLAEYPGDFARDWLTAESSGVLALEAEVRASLTYACEINASFSN